MVRDMQKFVYKALICAAVIMRGVTAFASARNPSMGDIQGRYIGVVFAVMAVALVVVVIIAVVPSKKKK